MRAYKIGDIVQVTSSVGNGFYVGDIAVIQELHPNSCYIYGSRAGFAQYLGYDQFRLMVKKLNLYTKTI